MEKRGERRNDRRDGERGRDGDGECGRFALSSVAGDGAEQRAHGDEEGEDREERDEECDRHDHDGQPHPHHFGTLGIRFALPPPASPHPPSGEKSRCKEETPPTEPDAIDSVSFPGQPTEWAPHTLFLQTRQRRRRS